MVSEGKMKFLAWLIQDEIQKEFSVYYLSGNLKKSVKIEKNGGNGYNITIEAPRYDIKEYKRTGVKISKPGSYASSVNETGGFSKHHKDYVNKCIERALQRWESTYRDEYATIRRM